MDFEDFGVLLLLLLCAAFVGLIVWIIGYTIWFDSNHECVEKIDVCQERYSYYNVVLKSTAIGYRDVSCEDNFDRIKEKCIEWKKKEPN